MAVWLVRAGSHGELQDNKLNPELRAELPLKQVWAVALTDEDDDG